VADTGGQYRIVVRSRDGARHDFGYTVFTNPPDILAQLPFGGVVHGRIEVPGQHAQYTFHANAGQTLTITPSPNCAAPLVMRLNDPGTFTTLFCGGLGPSRIDTTGEHSLTVFAFDRSTGDFELTASLG
jgi:hypothetical protein